MKVLRDSIVALVTPFTKDLEVDYKSYVSLVNFHLQSGTKGIVVSGTTGESSTLTNEEKLKLLEVALDTVKSRTSDIPIIFNSGSNDTKNSIMLSKKAEEVGADWLLVITPYYNKPTQEGLYNHFASIANSVNLPICLYNVPGRTSVNLHPSTIAKLAQISNILALKDATSCLDRPLDIKSKISKHSFTQLCGEDSTTLAYLAHGGDGSISVTANVAPKECQELYFLWRSGRLKEALNLHLNLFNLYKAMFIETNPTPVKYCLSLMNKCTPFVRQPLVELTENNKLLIKKLLKNLNLI